MSSFSIDFPDDLVFATLGDDIVVKTIDGVIHPAHKAEFNIIRQDEELVDRISDEYPTLEIQPEFASLYTSESLVMHNNKVYSVDALPQAKDANTLIVLLRDESREVW